MEDLGFKEAGRFLLMAGVILVVVGLTILIVGRIAWLGRLPGDLVVRGWGVTVYAPIVTCIVLSILLTLLLNLFLRR